MATPQRRESASTNKHETAGGDVEAAVARYLADLERAPLAARTRDAYGQHVRAYGAWLDGRPEPGVAISDPRARDYAARDFKRHLKVDLGWKPSSVNLALAAVDHFSRFVGLGPANVKREPLAQAAPRALSMEEQRALLRAVELARPRDGAIVTLLLYTALRLHELAALDVDDFAISARKGIVVVRSGKGMPTERCRSTDHAGSRRKSGSRRAASARATGARAVRRPAGPTLVATIGRPGCSGRGGSRRVEALGAHAPAHVRHDLVRSGNDIVLVAELAGHRRLDTTRRYSLPSEADRQAAMKALELEE